MCLVFRDQFISDVGRQRGGFVLWECASCQWFYSSYVFMLNLLGAVKQKYMNLSVLFALPKFSSFLSGTVFAALLNLVLLYSFTSAATLLAPSLLWTSKTWCCSKNRLGRPGDVFSQILVDLLLPRPFYLFHLFLALLWKPCKQGSTL